MNVIPGVIRYFTYRLRFPKAKIQLGARIGSGCRFGKGAVVEAGALIAQSEIGPAGIVHRGCRVVQSQLEEHTRICEGSRLYHSRIEAYSYVSEGSFIAGTTIGRFCSIGKVKCGRGDHPTGFVSTSPVFYSTNLQCGIAFTERPLFAERKPITLGHDVLISDNVFIRDGVAIGSGAIVGAGAVVVRDIPPYAVAVGVPAKVVRYRFPPDVIEALLDAGWWFWPQEELRAAQRLLARGDVREFLRWAGERGTHRA